VIVFLFLTPGRLPAPISEIGTPTPVPEQSARPKAKRTRKPEGIAKEVSPKPQSPLPAPKIQPTPQSRFAGAWSGELPTNGATIPETIIVDSTETTMTLVDNRNGHSKTGPVKRSGDTLTVTLGLWGTYWLTPSSDGSTAVLRYQNILDSRTALFHRATSVPASDQSHQ
jgi:hypothetical protein